MLSHTNLCLHLVFNDQIVCVASVSVWFRSKERQRNGILGFGRARNESGGRGRGRKGTPADKPLDFENLRSAPDWLG